MLDRRAFLGSVILPAASTALGIPAWRPDSLPLLDEIAADPRNPDDAAGDEALWAQVQQAFTIDRSVINLNNGGVSPSPAYVQEAMKRHLDYANTMPPPIALWRVQDPQRETVRAGLANHWGVDAEELALTRNSSEALQICQLGIDLRPGDEILCCTQDYPRMLQTFAQRARREGVIVRQIQIPIPAEDPAALVQLYRAAMTDKTRLMLLSHMINITGQIMPVREIVAAARERGIPVIVDGAHALAHFAFNLRDLDCDYYGVSLHKWLFAPHGTGLLFVRRDKVKDLWALTPPPDSLDDDIRKFEEIGTHPLANTLAIAEALTFHQAIGDQRKEARLRFLRDRWARRLLSHAGGRIRLHTSLRPAFSCGIGTFQADGLDSEQLSAWLWSRKHILTTAIKHAEFEGVRVTPSVYTTAAELDRFCDAVESALANGIG